MGLCKDPALTHLNKFGYNVVRLPRTGIEPLDVLGRDGKSFEKLGAIAQVWTSTEPAPGVGAPQPAANINGQKSDNLDLTLGLKMLGNVLSAMGAAVGLPSLALGYKQARSVTFRYTDVVSVSVAPFALGKFLTSGTLDMNNPFVTHYFGNEETEEYIIFDVLKSNTLGVTAKNDKGTEVKLDVPAIQQIVGANVSVNVGSASETEVVYEGKNALTFGFKVFEVTFENGKWTAKGTKAEGSLALAVGVGEAATKPEGILLSPAGMVRI